jgi:hypothetical protein
MEIGIVSEFNYLGVLLSKSGNFSMAKKTQVEKATKAMIEVLKRGKIHNLSIQCQLDLFDKLIKHRLHNICFTYFNHIKFLSLTRNILYIYL